MYYNFNPELNAPYNTVHPYQLKYVNAIADTVFSDRIKYIFLFGGSLELTCDKYSDLDLYVITDIEDKESAYKEVADVCRTFKKPYDILVSTIEDYLNNYKETGTVEHDIETKGVCIYAKK